MKCKKVSLNVYHKVSISGTNATQFIILANWRRRLTDKKLLPTTSILEKDLSHIIPNVEFSRNKKKNPSLTIDL